MPYTVGSDIHVNVFYMEDEGRHKILSVICSVFTAHCCYYVFKRKRDKRDYSSCWVQLGCDKVMPGKVTCNKPQSRFSHFLLLLHSQSLFVFLFLFFVFFLNESLCPAQNSTVCGRLNPAINMMLSSTERTQTGGRSDGDKDECLSS